MNPKNTSETQTAPAAPDLVAETLLRFTSLLSGQSVLEAAPPRDLLCETDGWLDLLVDPALGWMTPTSVAFVPANDRIAQDSRFVPYVGGVSMPGDEFAFGGDMEGNFSLQVHEYAICAFVPALEPTLVRVTNEDDLDLLMADADAAYTNGVFPEFLTSPMVLLADQGALGLRERPDLGSFFVAADGHVSLGPSGVSLGRLDEGFAAVQERFAHNAASPARNRLGAVLEAGRVEAHVAERPWLSGYLRALSAMQTLAAQRHTNVRVSGFGSRLSPSYGDHGWTPREPLILHNAQRAHVVASTGGGSQSFAVSREMAVCIEAMGITGERHQAIAAVAEFSGADPLSIRQQLDGVIDNLVSRGVVTEVEAS